MSKSSWLKNIFSTSSENPYSLGYLFEALKPRSKLEDFPGYGKPLPERPAHWKTFQHDYTYNGTRQAADLTVSEVSNPSRIILYALGWNSTPEEKKKVIENMNKEHNATVIVLPLKTAGDTLGTMAENIERIQSLAFDKDSALHKIANSKGRLPVHIVTHSSGANAYMHAADLPAERLKSVSNIVGVIHTAPFVDAAHASRDHHPVPSIIYDFHATMNPDKYVGTTLADRAYYYVNGLAPRILTEDPTSRPTHGQNLELMSYGRDIEGISREMNDNGTLHYLPRETIMYSTEDDFAGHEAAIDVGKERNIPEDRMIAVSGGHSILEQGENMTRIGWIMAQNEEEHYAYLQRPAPQQKEEDPGFIREALEYFGEDSSAATGQYHVPKHS